MIYRTIKTVKALARSLDSHAAYREERRRQDTLERIARNKAKDRSIR